MALNHHFLPSISQTREIYLKKQSNNLKKKIIIKINEPLLVAKIGVARIILSSLSPYLKCPFFFRILVTPLVFAVCYLS